MDIAALFYPRSVAVVGASRTPQTVGNDIVKNLVHQGYGGHVYPVNPKADELYGLKVYPSLDDLPETVDLVIIAIPALAVPAVLHQAGQRKTKAALVISAGFKEVGNRQLEREITEICQQYSMAMIGPNCLGLINPEVHLNASFAGIMPSFGKVAFISQSGALCSSVLDYAAELKIGFSKFVSLGNKALINETALLKYFAQDSETEVVAIYAEQLEDAERFIAAARQLTKSQRPKPIVILKSGRSESGAKAIASHTGSLAASDAIYDALCQQSGLIRVDTIQELFEVTNILSNNRVQAATAVAVVTNAGGPGVITTDAVMKAGLSLAEISPAAREKLAQFLPASANMHNPIDILGDASADRYAQTLEVLRQEPSIDAFLLLLTPQTMTEVEATARAIIAFRHKTTKPVIVSFIGQAQVLSAVKMLEEAGISTCSFPEYGVRGLAALHQAHTFATQPTETAFPPVTFALNKPELLIASDKPRFIPEPDAHALLAAYGLKTLQRQTLLNQQDAIAAEHRFSQPVALKILSPDLTHKSDVGGVVLNIPPSGILKASEALLQHIRTTQPQAKIEGVLAVEMAPPGGLELIIGAKRVPQLGSVVMVGMGGVFVEVFKDTRLGFVPLSPEYAHQMISELKLSPILKGARGKRPYDLTALTTALGRISQLMLDQTGIKELDINPFYLYPAGEGGVVLDARIQV